MVSVHDSNRNQREGISRPSGGQAGNGLYSQWKLLSDDDIALLEATGNGDRVLGGFTNGDISERLYKATSDRSNVVVPVVYLIVFVCFGLMV